MLISYIFNTILFSIVKYFNINFIGSNFGVRYLHNFTRTVLESRQHWNVIPRRRRRIRSARNRGSIQSAGFARRHENAAQQPARTRHGRRAQSDHFDLKLLRSRRCLALTRVCGISARPALDSVTSPHQTCLVNLCLPYTYIYIYTSID